MRKKSTANLPPLALHAPAETDAPEAADVVDAPGDEVTEALFAPLEPEGEATPPLAEPAAAVTPMEISASDAAAPDMQAPAAPAISEDAGAHWDPASKTPETRIAKSVPAKSTSTLPGWARAAYWIAIPAAVLWAGAMAAFASGYQNPFGPFEYRPFPAVAFAGLCLLPAIFILLAAYAVRQAAKLAVETRRARDLADDIAIPAALAADQAGGAAAAVRREVELAAAAASAAEHQLLSLRRALAEENERLLEATDDAARRAQDLTQGLAREREAMGGLTRDIDQQIAGVSQAITAQAHLVAEASDLAVMQVQEAEAALAARAADLAAAAGEAGELAHLAGQALSDRADGLRAAGASVADHIEGVQDALSSEQARLIALADSLRADQQHIAAQIEAQRTQLIAATADARAGAEDLMDTARESAAVLRNEQQQLAAGIEAQREQLVDASAEARAGVESLAELSRQSAEVLRDDQERLVSHLETQRAQVLAAGAEVRSTAGELADISAQSAQSLRELIAAVAEQVGQLAATAEADQAVLANQAQTNLKLFTGAVAEERAALERETRDAIEALAAAASDTRKAALEQTEAARERVQQLGEAAFAAGQKADTAFAAQIGAARNMIETSAGLVEQAGQRSAERIEAGLAAAHGTLGELETLLGAIDAKVAALPEDARNRAEAVRRAVEQGIGDLTAAARKAAEETQVIDAAFQGRIKQNYEVLSEALRLMGRVAGAADSAAKATPSQPRPAVSAPAPIAAAPPPAPTRTPAPAVNAAMPETDRSIRVPPETFAAPPAMVRRDAEPAETLGLRPRLRLTPDTPAPTAPRQPAPAAAAEAPLRSRGDPNEWTWKDLLSSIDEPPLDDEVLAERLISEIEALGLDAPALLPLARIDEIAAVMQAGDVAGARDVVRNLAPSAVRRLSRRVLTDKVLRAHADRYLQRYEDLLSDSAKRDRDGFVTATLLGSDPGRAFLLFNAAVGELH